MAREAPQPFDIEVAMQRLRVAVAMHPRAVLFQLAEEGHRDPFAILVACVLTIRTLEEQSLPAARRLLATASTPASLAAMDPSEIEALIPETQWPGQKARTIHGIALAVLALHGGVMPCDLDAVIALHGVGPKCAALALGIGCGQAHLPVDIHVHRITNRWGIIAERTPEQSQRALMAVLPQQHWLELNALLVPFGKHVCTGTAPRCRACPLREMCARVGVTSSR